MPDLHDRPHRSSTRCSASGCWCRRSAWARPWLGQIEPPSAASTVTYDPLLSLSGNARAGTRNPRYEGTFVFDNDFPALSIDPASSPQNPSTGSFWRPGIRRLPRRLLLSTPRRGAAVAVDTRVAARRGRLDRATGRSGREAGHDLRADLREPRRADGGEATRTRTARSGPVRLPDMPAREQASFERYRAAHSRLPALRVSCS